MFSSQYLHFKTHYLFVDTPLGKIVVAILHDMVKTMTIYKVLLLRYRGVMVIYSPRPATAIAKCTDNIMCEEQTWTKLLCTIGLTLKTLRKKECRDLYFVTIYLVH